MTIKWFGHMYTAPAYLDTEEIATPVGEPCTWCDEPILEGDDGWVASNGPPFHRACWMRQTIGSLAHIEKRCSCFVPGSDASDPPGMSKRQAAEAAWAAFSSRRS